MPTPQIVIPYEEKPVSIWAGLREAFSFNWATASLAAASLFAVVAFGAYVVSVNSVSEEKAGLTAVNSVAVPTPTNTEVPKPSVVASNEKIVPVKAASDEPARSARPVKAVQAKSVVRPSQPRVRSDVNNSAIATSNNKRSIDTLDDDSEDDSLRLTDLFDAEDTRL